MHNSQRKRGVTARRNLRSMALALDPTTAEWKFCVAQVVRPREIIVRLSSGGILGKNPVKCLFEVVKNANSLFTQGFSKYHKHSG
jgi:hypothetical protein